MPGSVSIGGNRGATTPLTARLCAVLCALFSAGILAAAERAEAQNPPGAAVGVNPANQLVIDPLNGLPNNLVIGLNPDPQFVFVFDPLNSLLPGPGCQFLNPGFRHLTTCLPIPPNPSLSGMTLALQALAANELKILPTLPALPGPNQIQGGNKADAIQGGQSDEQINAGKGKDNVNPGAGEDDVNLGAGNDKANTKDGEVDKVNGGKGNRDEATVDKGDKVKNVEVVKRK